jgi:hypothetical protein
MDKTFNKIEAIAAQKKVAALTNAPHFAPLDGNCYRCRKNIYEPQPRPTPHDPDYVTGITVESAGGALITGCPHCSATYCD